MPVISGESGEVWTNSTEKILFQFHCNFSNSCGLCIQFANQIGNFWPIPLHAGCNCRQVAVRPGARAAPFIDYQKAVAELDKKQQARVMGLSNWKLVESGAVKWSDVVTKARVKDFHQVVAEQKLSVKAMTGMGISPFEAKKALGLITTPAHLTAVATRKALVEELRKGGLSDAEIQVRLVEKLKQRVQVKRGPEPPTSLGPKPPTPSTPPVSIPKLAPKPKAKPTPSPVPIPTVRVAPSPAEHATRFPGLTITPDQVAEYTRHSVEGAMYTHRTFPKAKADLLTNGIKMEKANGVYGQGLYVSTKPEKTYGPVGVEVVMDIRNPLRGDSEFLYAKWREWGGNPTAFDPSRFSDLARERGYDAIVTGWHGSAPGAPDDVRWAVTINPDQVRFIVPKEGP